MLFFLAILLPALLSSVGSILLFKHYFLLKNAENHLKLNQYRSKDTALPDKLNYQEYLEDGIILNKDGSLLAGFSYKAPDIESSTPSERNYFSEMLNKALAYLGEGWVAHIDVSRSKAPNYFPKERSHFGDKITEAIDQERREYFKSHGALFDTKYVISLSWLPPALLTKKYTEFFVSDSDENHSLHKHAKQNLEKFKEELAKFEDALSLFFKIKRLKPYKTQFDPNNPETKTLCCELLEYLRFCVSGKHYPLTLPCERSFIDYIVGSQEMYSGLIPYIGGKYIQIVAIEGFPNETYPSILNILTQLPIPYRWSSRLIFIGEHQAISLFDKQRKKWRQQVHGMKNHNNSPNLDAQNMEADAIAALAETRSQEVKQAFFSSNIILMNEDREKLVSHAKFVATQINKIGFVARIETVNTLDAFFGSLPAHAVENVRRPVLNTRNIGDILPTNSLWEGNAKTPCDKYPADSPALMQCVTGGSTPFYLNLHVGDVGHTLIFGPTGAGKSVLLTLTEAQLRRYLNMTIFAFDKGMSMFPLASAIHAATEGKSGHHFEIGGEDCALSFAPLQYLETANDRAWAISWIEDILKLNGITVTPQKSKSIADAIAKMADTNGETSLSAFENFVQDEEIRLTLAPYILSGQMSHLLSAEKDSLSLSDFNVFEIEELMELDDKFKMPVLLYLFRRIQKALKGQPAAIVLDEAWLMLGNEVFREKIREWLKVLRKANCSVILATQSISDAANSGILDVLIESCKTKIFLPNPNAKNDKPLYEKFGLNDRQIEIISTAQQKREYYVVSDEGRRLFSLALGDFALSFVAVSDKENIKKIKHLIKKYGNGWVEEWLSLRGIKWPENTLKNSDPSSIQEPNIKVLEA